MSKVNSSEFGEQEIAEMLLHTTLQAPIPNSTIE